MCNKVRTGENKVILAQSLFHHGNLEYSNSVSNKTIVKAIDRAFNRQFASYSLKVELGRKNEIFYYSKKEHLKISRICKV